MEGGIIIGISGFGGNGKTTLSDYFVQNHGFKRVSFADPIRKMLMALGLEEDDLRNPEKKNSPHPRLMGKTPVQAMEALGTGWGRNLIHPNLWVNHFMHDGQGRPFLICDDVRHENEVAAIRQMGGVVVKLVVPGKEPVRNTDFEVQKLGVDQEITNVIGETRMKDIYTYVHGVSFKAFPDMTFDEWKRRVTVE